MSKYNSVRFYNPQKKCNDSFEYSNPDEAIEYTKNFSESFVTEEDKEQSNFVRLRTEYWTNIYNALLKKHKK